MFLLRQQNKGMMACFVEVDLETMSEGQWIAKLRRYEVWSQSEAGNRWLTELYTRYGANSPRPVFRVLAVANRKQRKSQLVEWSQNRRESLKGRLWFTCVDEIEECRGNVLPLAGQSTDHIVL